MVLTKVDLVDTTTISRGLELNNIVTTLIVPVSKGKGKYSTILVVEYYVASYLTYHSEMSGPEAIHSLADEIGKAIA